MSAGYVRRKISLASSRGSSESIAKIAREYRQRSAASNQDYRTETLLDFVPRISPDLERPEQLSPYAEILSRAVGGNLRVVFAAPPQHGKTELTLRAFLWWALRFPGKRHAYVTYNNDRAEYVSRKFQDLAVEAGLQPEGSLAHVRLKGGTEIKFTSIGGSLTGYAIDGVCVIDDPIKDRTTAESPTIRRRAIEWFTDVARSRRHAGTSFIAMATRWHPEDLSGQLIKRGYEYINLKAIAEGEVDRNGRVISDPLHRRRGEALWPSRKPVEFFAEDQADAYTWASLYQGEPRPRGGKVFGEPRLYTSLPEKGYRGAFGLDLAYSGKTHADWSICVELWIADGDCYVVDVQRKQVDAPSFALTLKAKKTSRPWRMHWYAAGTEKGSADFLIRQGLPVVVTPPKGDKFTRAIPVAAAWNSGKILLPDPEHVPIVGGWLSPFLDVVQNFTGVGDLHDDDVDALASAYDALHAPVTAPRGPMPDSFAALF